MIVEVLLSNVIPAPRAPVLTWRGHLYVQVARFRDTIRQLETDDQAEAIALVETVISDLRADLENGRAVSSLPF